MSEQTLVGVLGVSTWRISAAGPHAQAQRGATASQNRPRALFKIGYYLL